LKLGPLKEKAYLLLPVNSNETLLQELSISLLKNARQIGFEGCFESSKILLSTVALESRFNLLSKRSELLSHKTVRINHRGKKCYVLSNKGYASAILSNNPAKPSICYCRQEMATSELAQRRAKAAWASEIYNGFLWLGSGNDAENLEGLQECKITHVLNVADDVPNYFPEQFIYHNLQVADFGADQGITRVFESAFKFVEEVKAHDGGRVLVHCAAGINRSATLTIALVMHFEPELTLADAFKKVLEKRGISPFKDNRKQLLQWEMQVRDGKSSMKDDD
jgi:hypothetical protein